MSNNITWLHLSDLHFKSGKEFEQFNRKIVLDSLWIDIQEQIQQELQPDFIVFTGDIAYHGKKDEYDLAIEQFFEPLLKHTGLSKDRLFIVPGNHDIDRKKITPKLRKEMLEFQYNRDKINQFLLQRISSKRRSAFRKFSAYAKFINSYFKEYLNFDDFNSFYNRVITINSAKIAIIGLNSTWMSGNGMDYQNQVFDQGNLLIGEYQLEKALEIGENVDLKIAIFHHPVEWLHELEHFSIKKRLESECNFILHGHSHIQQMYDTRSLSGHTVSIPGGAVYTSRDLSNSYNFVKIDLASLKGELHIRKYIDTEKKWMKDIYSTGEEHDGIVEFSYSKKVVEKGKEIPGILSLPVIVITMTKEEIGKLMVSEDLEIKHMFKKINVFNIEEFKNRYDILSRDKWRPFGTEKTVTDLLIDSAKGIEIKIDGIFHKVQFQFNTERFFSDNPSDKDFIRKCFAENICIFVIDGIAMLHSDTTSRFSYYSTGSEKHFIHLIISPIDHSKLDFNRYIENAIRKSLIKFFDEHDKKLSTIRAFGIGNEIDFLRFIKISLREINLSERKMQLLKDKLTNAGIEETGIHEIVF